MMTTTTMVLSFPRLFELPSEVFLQVLTRVPIKYLFRLRCVSKGLLDLTNNPDFISLYNLQTKTNPNLLFDFSFNNTVPRLSPPPLPDDHHHLANNSSLSSTTSIDLNNLWRFHIVIKGSNFIYLGKQRHKLIPFNCRPDHKHLVSSSNGLVCFAGFKSLEIYNILSGANYLVESNAVENVFGFDPKSNDYKIVSFNCLGRWDMFSFRTNSWKRLVVNRPIAVSTIWRNSKAGLSICINGVIYWPLHPEDFEEDGIGFASFNLHQEKLVGIKPPPLDNLPTIQYSDLQLLSFRGCPCFVYMRRSRKAGRRTTTKSTTAEEESSHSHSDGCGFRVELFILKSSGGDNVENVYWIRDSIGTPFWFPKKVEIVSLYDEIFLSWVEAKHLRLYNIHTKCFFKLPISSDPSVYYPKVSRSKTKHNPTYVENFRFDFSLI